MTKIMNRGKVVSSQNVKKGKIGSKIIYSLKKELKLNKLNQIKGHIDHDNHSDYSDCS